MTKNMQTSICAQADKPILRGTIHPIHLTILMLPIDSNQQARISESRLCCSISDTVWMCQYLVIQKIIVAARRMGLTHVTCQGAHSCLHRTHGVEQLGNEVHEALMLGLVKDDTFLEEQHLALQCLLATRPTPQVRQCSSDNNSRSTSMIKGVVRIDVAWNS